MKQLIAERLRLWMKETPHLGTQVRLAKKSGVAQATIGRILRAEVDPGICTLSDICRALNRPVTELLDPDVSGTEADQLLRLMREQLAALSQEDRQHLRHLLSLYARKTDEQKALPPAAHQ